MDIFCSTLIGAVVGGIITFLVARHFYIQAADDLVKETKELRNLHRITLEVLEHAGFVELRRDSSGEITGAYKDLSASLNGSAALRTQEDKVITPKDAK